VNSTQTQCWRCGKTVQVPSDFRYPLCGDCEMEVDPPRVSGWMDVPEYFLTHCWICKRTEVPRPEKDSLGVCPECRPILSEV
jgi:hypothetical protein